MSCAAALVLGITGTLPAAAHATSAHAKVPRFLQTDLVSDLPGRAPLTDHKLVNPWGMSMGPRLWVSDADADVSTVYSGGGTAGKVVKQPLEVAVPGGPTGQVFNGGHGFVVRGKGGAGPASFVFATESGTIAGWNATADPTHAIVAAKVRRASFKGLALLGSHLLAADFFHGRIVVFDRHFHRVPGGFRDPGLPRGYAPFNVAAVHGSVFVAYAKRNAGGSEEIAGPGNGFVSQFSASGRFLRRFASHGALNAPWALTVAPRGFGSLTGALLVGNFGDGRINAYDRSSGRFLGPLRKADGKAIAIEGLWGLVPGTAANGGASALWFAAGIDDEKHGLLGLIRPVGLKTGPPMNPYGPPPRPY
jgi:uncharacterized protein (TIGR03118 family)